MPKVRFSKVKSELQRLLFQRLESLTIEYKAVRDKQADLEDEADSIVNDIGTLRAALDLEGRLSGQMEESTNGSDKDKFIGLGLRDSVALLRSEQPLITKGQVKQRLLGVDFNFKGKNPGNAIHMAWISLDRVNK